MSDTNEAAHGTPAPAESFHLPIEGFQGTPEEIEQQWFEKVYRGRGDSMAQLTWRAVLMGSLLGGVLSLTNLYIGLKAGWGFGVAITACILSYAIWTTLVKIGIARTPMTVLENNCMQSTASSAGYSTGGTLISAFAAYILLNGHPLPLGITFAWVFFLAVLGVTMAVPMKRQMINVEQLRFPSGIAAAETLQALHAHGNKGLRAARALGIAGIVAALDKFWAEGLPLIDKLMTKWFHLSTQLENLSSAHLIEKVQTLLLGKETFALWRDRTVWFSWDAIFVAAGAITGMRVCTTMLISGTLCWAVFVPIMQHEGVITGSGFRNLVQWTLWGGTACMVSGGILSFILQWKSVLRAFKSLGRIFGRNQAAASSVDDIETPMSWFVMAQLISLIALTWLAHVSFGMPWWQSVLAVVLSFFLALVACRITGETDTTPIGAMGKVTQLTFGAINPGNVNVNLMAANITAAAAASSADLLTDLKSGYLLGAHPRKQFLAQFAGIFIGTVVTVFAFSVLVPNAGVLGTEQFPAPAAQTWAAVAKALSKGLEALEPVKVWSIVIGGAVGVIFSVLPLMFPKQAKYLPSAAAFGLSWVFDWYYSLLFFIGAVLGWWLERKRPAIAKEFTFPVASGIIAGGSLMGVALIFWQNGPAMWNVFWPQIRAHLPF
ncbi:MAG TPA: OPT family oligopeptide transporter [Verrucomicrobiae bacterium]|nr:OPT family oligopeptide transporter [Verrucomicrobiae bacterium]